MKVIIAGSRDIVDYDLVCRVIAESGFEITEVVCGMARGVDTLGKKWADDNGVPVKPFKPDWTRYGKGAGMERNTDMAKYADALIAVTHGTRGTEDMIKKARMHGLQRHIERIG